MFKFDGTANSGTPRDWEYEFRAKTPGDCYDFWSSNCRSYNIFYDLKDILGNLVAVGFTRDLTQYDSGATFVDGLIVKLNS